MMLMMVMILLLNFAVCVVCTTVWPFSVNVLRLVQVEAYVRTDVLHQRGVLQLAFRLQYTSLHVAVVIGQYTHEALYEFE